MPNQIDIKTPESSAQLFHRRVMQVIAIVLILTFLLFIRLFYLQVIEKKYYATMSTNNSISLVPLDPPRGLIYDRNGVILAQNMPVFNLEITPDKVPDLTATVAQLHEFIKLTPDDVRTFYKQIAQKRPFDPITLKVKLTDEEVAGFYVNQYRFPGVKVAARLIRYYPFQGDMVDFLGYTGRINQEELATVDPGNYSGTNYIGKLGIERYYETQLHGTTGYQQVEVDVDGKSIRTLNDLPPTPGENIYLTIDSALQEAAVNAFQGFSGALIAIDPQNGQILAMVSAPTYDPNLFVRGIDNDTYQSLRNSPDQPLFNRSIRGLYPPGSTIKPIYALQGLESGNTTEDFTIFDPGYFQLKGSSHKYRDWKPEGHGWVNLNKAIAQSCDTYFFTMADKMGSANLIEVLNEFGFGKTTGIEILEEAPGLLPSPDWRMRARGQRWYKGDTLNLSIGQGDLLATPLQLAVMTSIIANRGMHYQPTLLLKTTTTDGQTHDHLPVTRPPVSFSDKTWKAIIQGMVDVIQSDGGTGYRFGRPKYPVAAKTGTAQLFTVAQNQKYSELKVAAKLRDNSMFIAFAPVDRPQIVVAVAVQNNHAASMIARKVMDFYLLKENHLNIQPTTQTSTPPQTQVEPLENDHAH